MRVNGLVGSLAIESTGCYPQRTKRGNFNGMWMQAFRPGYDEYWLCSSVTADP